MSDSLQAAKAPDRAVNFQVTGMHCAACAARVERAVGALPGVESATVNLLQNNLKVEFASGAAEPERVVAAVHSLGFEAEAEDIAPSAGAALPEAALGEAPLASERPRSADSFAVFLERQSRQEAATAKRLQALRKELVLAFAGTIPLLLLSMGQMLGLPLPAWLAPGGSPVLFACAQLLLTLPAVWAGRDIFRNGTRQLRHLAPGMDSLVCLGAGAALVYSLWQSAALLLGPASLQHAELYYESAAVVLTLVMLGRYLELRSRAKTGDALRALIRLNPETAVRLENGERREIPLAEVKVGDTLLVRPGESVPVDGEVLEGESAVDESMLTGESLPVDKAPGASLTGGSLNRDGALTMRALAVGGDTVLARMARLVWEAQGSKAPISNLADRISLYFVPAVLGLALLSGGLWYFAGGESFAFALRMTIAVLVVACPCAMGLATPTSIMVGTGVGAQMGVLVRGGAALEAAGRVDTVVFDKTGTLTRNEVAVLDKNIFPQAANIPLPADMAALRGGENVEAFLERICFTLAGSLGSLSTHPLSVALAAEAEKRGFAAQSLEEFVSIAGRGVKAVYLAADGAVIPVALGNPAFMLELAENSPKTTEESASPELSRLAAAAAREGASPLFLAVRGLPVAMFNMAAPLRPEAKEVVEALQKSDLRVLLLSGDNRATVEGVGAKAGISEFRAEVLPEDKEKVVAELGLAGRKTAMVGDGVNDAPALAAATLGIAVGGGARVAVEAADIVLMRDDLYGVPTALALGRATLRNIRQNLAWAFGYNLLCLPVAAGLLHIFGGPTLSPMLAGAAMAFSSVSVVANALRLRGFKG